MAVIGGGVIGCSVAYRAAKRGTSVVLLAPITGEILSAWLWERPRRWT